MNLHIIIHESFEGPAAIEAWALDKGHDITYTRLYDGDALPEAHDFDFLVVMGGPQSPATTVEESPHFDAKREIAFIKTAIDQHKTVLGVCLGAQLIGEALGAPFEHSPNREIGVFPVALTEDGRRDVFVGAFPERFLVGHWHGDMPGLSAEANVLAVSEGCPRQIVRYAPRIYGFQCHFEFTAEAINQLIEHGADELERHGGQPYVKPAATLRGEDYTAINALLCGFLDRISMS